MVIKKADAKDINMLVSMTKQLFEDEHSDVVLSEEEFCSRLLTYLNNGCSAYLFVEDDVIGYALVNLNKKPCYLVDFFINRKYRRNGKGTESFNRLMKELKIDNIDLDVFCWNERGRKFWNSLGFEERAIIMRRHVITE